MADEVKRNTTLTYAGYDLMAKCFTGNTINISKIVLGDGFVPEGVSDIKTMTAVVNPILALPIVYKRVDGTGTAVIECQLTNIELDVGFWDREVGVYAKDPDTGDEILYAYRNVGNYPDFIPAAGSGEMLNTVYSIIIVVGQIENVEVTITEGVGSVSRAEYYEHLGAVNPHPQFLQVDVNKVKDCVDVWVGNGEQRRLQRIGIDDLRTKILGADGSTIPELAGRMTQVELEQLNQAFSIKNKTNVIMSSTEPLDPKTYWLYNENAPDSTANKLFSILNLSNMIFYDDFKPITEINVLKLKVNAVTAGSRTIGLESLEGIHLGESYTITDGVKSENVQVKSSSKNGNLLRVVCKSDVVNTYDLSKTYLYRTTAGLKNGSLLSDMSVNEEIIFNAKEFRSDGIRKLAYAQGLIRHSKLTGVKIRAFVSFIDEIVERKGAVIGLGAGAKQTLTLPDEKIDYASIRVYVNGVETKNFDANTETNPVEITLTAAKNANITADYKCNYNEEDWREMNLVTVQNYENTDIIASKFEFSIDPSEAEKTRACVKWRLEKVDDTATTIKVYGVAAGFAKVKEMEAAE